MKLRPASWGSRANLPVLAGWATPEAGCGSGPGAVDAGDGGAVGGDVGEGVCEVNSGLVQIVRIVPPPDARNPVIEPFYACS